ncbi:MAG: beta-ketoacyl-ACP synthase 3, partial [Clostridia bacterium]|nr:beta-ketoacyl-ACP synthase 3 [Clostridia bacterium]
MKILGTGSAVPELVITNEELTRFLDTSDEWIQSRTGIRERRIHRGELTELAAQAAKKAIENAGLAVDGIDYILCSNVYNRYLTPALSCVVQGMIGAHCPCLDLNGACAGFLYALETADGLLRSGRYRNILILAAEEPSRMADWTDRATCVLFGDAAAAVVVSAGGEEPYFRMDTVSNTEFLIATNTAGNCPYETTEREHKALYMNGQEVYKFAVNAAARDLAALCAEAGKELSKVSAFLLHQANLRILEAVRMRLKQPREKFPHN